MATRNRTRTIHVVRGRDTEEVWNVRAFEDRGAAVRYAMNLQDADSAGLELVSEAYAADRAEHGGSLNDPTPKADMARGRHYARMAKLDKNGDGKTGHRRYSVQALRLEPAEAA